MHSFTKRQSAFVRIQKSFNIADILYFNCIYRTTAAQDYQSPNSIVLV